jgi:hypothetical protein
MSMALARLYEWFVFSERNKAVEAFLFLFICNSFVLVFLLPLVRGCQKKNGSQLGNSHDDAS